MATSDPPENVDLTGIRERVANTVDGNLKKSVRRNVLVIVDVRLHLDAFKAIYNLRVIGMERKLHIRFAKLDLLVAVGCSVVEKAEAWLSLKFIVEGGRLYLLI